MRADPGRALDSRGCLQLAGCPVVVELAAAHLVKYHPRRDDLHVMPGEPGQVMQGVQLLRIHVNQRYFKNFCETMVRGTIPGEACGGGSPSWTTCGKHIAPADQLSVRKGQLLPGVGYRSRGNGYVYCPCCARYVIGESTLLGLPRT